MAATKARTLVPFKDFTHTLSITLGGPSFHSQFQTSLERFQKTASQTIPVQAFIPLELASRSYLGKVDLNTGKKRRVAEFSKVLHGLDFHKLLGPARESAQSSPVATNQVGTAQSSVSYGTPLRFDLKGLMTGHHDASDALSLEIPFDPTDRLDRFWHSVRESFSAAGFPLLDQPTPHAHIVSSLMARWGPQGYVLLPNGARKYQKPRFRLQRFDARDLIKAYENEIWAKDVHLQRLCVCELGSTENLPDGGKVFN